MRWKPPFRGELKLNFDAAYEEGVIVTGVVLRDSDGRIMGAWTNRFMSDNPFCAETEVAIQALKIAVELRIENATFEGDAAFVILALQGLSEFEDWRAVNNIKEGRQILSSHYLWSIQYSLRSCNRCGHILAKWAKETSFFGFVNSETLPVDVREADSRI